MESLIPFDFQGHAVRVIEVEGEPWFVAKDVSNLLGFSATSAMIRSLDDDEKGVHNSHTLGGAQQLAIINEPGLYSAIIRSKRPEAKHFKRWITHEVLPSIRKTGGYGLQAIDWGDSKQVAGLLAQSIEKVQEQAKQLEDMQPKAEFHDQVAMAQDAISVAQAAKILNTGRRRLFAFLRQIQWVTRRNEPYQDKINAGLLDVKLGSWEHPDHGLQQSVTTLVTGKGLTKLQRLWETKDQAA